MAKAKKTAAREPQAARTTSHTPTRARARKGTTRSAAKVDWAPSFLAVFASSGNITAACKAVQIGRSTLYDRRTGDPAFAEKFRHAEEEAADALEAEARRRALEGAVEPVFGTMRDEEGRAITGVVGSRRRMSDPMLTTLLKARKPDVFATRVNITMISETELDQELQRLEDQIRAKGGEVPVE